MEIVVRTIHYILQGNIVGSAVGSAVGIVGFIIVIAVGIVIGNTVGDMVGIIVCNIVGTDILTFFVDAFHLLRQASQCGMNKLIRPVILLEHFS